MGAWDFIEEALDHQEVAVALSIDEQRLVAEALALVVRDYIEQNSVWPLLERLSEAKKPVAGFTPDEAAALQRLPIGRKAVVKQGNKGAIISMEPEVWMHLLQRMAADPRYFKQQLRGLGSIDDFVKKVKAAVGPSGASINVPSMDPDLSGPPTKGADVYGQKTSGIDVASLYGAEGQPDIDMVTGRPTDDPMKRAKVGSGVEPPAGAPDVGQDEPFVAAAGFEPPPASPFASRSEDPAARRKRVAAQDAAMMGGKTKPIGKVTVK